jgi:hypothetical protein
MSSVAGAAAISCRQTEVAAVVKLLPSLTQRLVVMQIWQAAGPQPSESPDPAARQNEDIDVRNNGNESKRQITAAETPDKRSPACSCADRLSHILDISSLCPTKLQNSNLGTVHKSGSSEKAIVENGNAILPHIRFHAKNRQ